MIRLLGTQMLGETIYNRYVPRPSGRDDECNKQKEQSRDMDGGVFVVSSLNRIRKKQNVLLQRKEFHSSVRHKPTNIKRTQPIDRPS